MHELSIAENILEISLRHAQEAGASRVTDIYLVIGRLSSFVDDSIQFYWDFMSENTICAGAALHFERIPARLLCQSCNLEYTLDAELVPCPSCSSAYIKVIAGEEFRVDSIQVEKEG
jgi:hydrogenase nickel incorporation protein HypA/HybF